MKFNNFRSKIADEFELPDNILSDNFEICIYGHKRIMIENYKGIVVFENNNVIVRTKIQDISVTGSDFKIEEADDSQISICGKIEEIKLIPKE